jgi:diadenosine tetraphosphatase ApaH/serine/threonine PP2A family protein phosphatase
VTTYLLLSDIHANLEALEAVLEADRVLPPPDAVLLLGDVVGYGPDPAAVIDRLRNLPWILMAIRGNHDRVVAGIDDGTGFNGDALTAARWARTAIGADDRRWLATLPRGPLTLPGGELAVHGSPLDEDHFLFSAESIRLAFDSHPAGLIFCGHTHHPRAAVLDGHRCTVTPLQRPKEELSVVPGQRLLFNPGSVGQPRDGDPRASYARYDAAAGRITLLRVAYDYRPTVRKMHDAGLPDPLCRRLAAGR